MKYLKSYENINEPQVGDYVIAMPDYVKNNDFKIFFDNNIGQIVKIERGYTGEKLCAVEYENIPYSIKKVYSNWREENGKQFLAKYIWFSSNLIIHSSNNKEDLKNIIEAKKYNL